MTPREHKALLFIATHIADTGYAPTLSEIGDQLGLRNRSSVHKVVSSLERQGRVVRDRYAKRGLLIPNDGPAAGPRPVAEVLAAIPTETLRLELHRRQETLHG